MSVYEDTHPRPRYIKTRHECVCERCGETSTAMVSIDRWANVACFTCPECGEVQEP